MKKLNESITIQKWIIVLFLPLIVTLMGFTLNIVMANQNVKNRVETNEIHIEKNTVDIKELETQKVNKDNYIITVQRVYDILDRIENKVDNLNK